MIRQRNPLSVFTGGQRQLSKRTAGTARSMTRYSGPGPETAGENVGASGGLRLVF